MDTNALITIIFIIIVVIVVLVFISIVSKPKRNEWQTEAGSKLSEIMNANISLKEKLINMDKLMEFSLKNNFNIKESFGQILKIKSKSFDRKQLNDIWFAHKLRNNVVHDISANPDEKELKNAISIFYRETKKMIG